MPSPYRPEIVVFERKADGKRTAECPDCGHDIVAEKQSQVEKEMRAHGAGKGHPWRRVKFMKGTYQVSD